MFSRPGRRALEVGLVVLGSLAFAVAFTYPIVANMTGLGLDHDWDLTMEMHWAPFYTVAHFHQLPLWDPYKCGGVPLLGNPQSRILTPFFLVHLLFGPLLGIHLEIIAHLAIGFGGAYLLARQIDIGKLGAFACGATFAGSSWYSLRMAPGHSVFLCIMYIPWVVALFWMGWRNRQLMFAVPTGFAAALIFFEGGIYQTTHVALVLLLLALVLGAQYRSLFPLLLLSTSLAFELLFAAPKLVPAVHFVGFNPRTVDPFEVNTLSMFGQELFSRNQFFSRDSMGGFWGFWEFGAYIGFFFAGMAMLGGTVRFRRALPWSVTTLVLLSLAAGNHGAYSPWVLLHRFPVFSAQHAPTRLLMTTTLFVGVLAGFGVDAICSLRRIWLTIVIGLLTLAATVDCWWVGVSNMQYLLGGGEHEPFRASPNFQQFYLSAENRSYMMALANLGAVNCYESAYSGAHNAYGSNQLGYHGEQYLIGNGTVRLVRWTPNRLDYDVDANGKAVVVVNQNFDPEWKVVKGEGEPFQYKGLLSIRVPSGRQRLTIEYYGAAFLIGCEIFLVGILGAITLYVWSPVWDKRRISASVTSAGFPQKELPDEPGYSKPHIRV